MNTIRRAIGFIGAFLLLAWFDQPAVWCIPPGFNLQGRLTDPNGINRNGLYQLKFTIYDSAANGNNLWSKSFPAVNVVNGNFQLLPSDPDDTGRTLANAFNVLAPFLEVQVMGGPNITLPESPLVPRQPMASVPFAFQSGGIVSAGPATISAGGNTVITALTDGNVGIGTGSPGATLDVRSAGQPVNWGPTAGAVGALDWTTSGAEIYGLSGKVLALGANGSEKMRITIAGNIGIGATNPQSKLDVNGGLAVGSYAGVNPAPSGGAIVSGNVGIGTPSPGQKLSVAGTIESTSGGFKFPDGTTQTSAASPGVVQVVAGADLSSNFFTTSPTYVDTGVTVTIAPTSASSRILIHPTVTLTPNTNATGASCALRIYRGAAPIGTEYPFSAIAGNGGQGMLWTSFGPMMDSPGTTNTITYHIYMKVAATGWYLLATGFDPVIGPASVTPDNKWSNHLIVEEVR